MTDERLSPHFLLREFLRSETAVRMGREIVPTDAEIANLRLLCMDCLEPVRVELGAVITILSGLRPLWLNGAVGGSKTSAHIDGRAADIIAAGMTPLVLSRWIAKRAIPYDQIIYEGGWCHIGMAKVGEQPRHQLLTARFAGGAVTYETGLNE